MLGAIVPGAIGGVLTDPPYSSGGLHAGDRIRAPSQKYQSSEYRHLQAEFVGDNRDQRSFLAWSGLWMHRARLGMRPGAILAAFTDWRQLPVTTDALQTAGLVWRGIVPWDKTEAVRPQMGRYRNQAEFLVWGTNGHRASVGRIAPGAYRASVPRAKLHMAAKPVSLMRDLLAIIDGPGPRPVHGLLADRRGLRRARASVPRHRGRSAPLRHCLPAARSGGRARSAGLLRSSKTGLA